MTRHRKTYLIWAAGLAAIAVTLTHVPHPAPGGVQTVCLILAVAFAWAAVR